jgi:outer membrane biosynthesis protein TonB
MEENPEAPTPAEAPKPAPVMDVVPPPAAAPQPDNVEPQVDKPEPKAAAKPPAPKPVTPKRPSTGMTPAIIATVIIVLGLAALAVYAYLKTSK